MPVHISLACRHHAHISTLSVFVTLGATSSGKQHRKSVDKGKRCNQSPKQSASSTVTDSVVGNCEANHSSAPIQNVNKCPFCYLAPCVTSFPHHWLGPGQQACVENTAIRRARYKSYWRYIANKQGWNTPDYVAKKSAELLAAGRVYHERELMPRCVLEQVRRLYPNPTGQPYMNHKWD